MRGDVLGRWRFWLWERTKWGYGGRVTQRIAYLNKNALQQLYTYSVGTLPRPYDRSVVSNTFMIDQGILEKTLSLRLANVFIQLYNHRNRNLPILIRAYETENKLEEFIVQPQSARESRSNEKR